MIKEFINKKDLKKFSDGIRVIIKGVRKKDGMILVAFEKEKEE